MYLTESLQLAVGQMLMKGQGDVKLFQKDGSFKKAFKNYRRISNLSMT